MMTQLFGLRSRSCRKKIISALGNQSENFIHLQTWIPRRTREIHAPLSGARFHRTGPSEHPSRTRPSQPEHPDRSLHELPPFAKQRRAPPKTRRIPPEASPAAWPRRPPARGAANRPRPGWRAFSSSRSSWTQDRSRESASKPWVAAARRASSSATTHVRETPACAAWNSLSEL